MFEGNTIAASERQRDVQFPCTEHRYVPVRLLRQSRCYSNIIPIPSYQPLCLFLYHAYSIFSLVRPCPIPLNNYSSHETSKFGTMYRPKTILRPSKQISWTVGHFCKAQIPYIERYRRIEDARLQAVIAVNIFLFSLMLDACVESYFL